MELFPAEIQGRATKLLIDDVVEFLGKELPSDKSLYSGNGEEDEDNE
jgi:hypothetical protein